MKEFLYITDKIMDTNFSYDPFKQIYIEDFFSKEHFELITTANQIKFPIPESTENLISYLQEKGYAPVNFPGCTTSIEEYLNWYNYKKIKNLYNKDIVEGFGMAFNLEKIDSLSLQNLINFLNGDHFHQTLRKKFDIINESYVTTRIQKYLTGYEISPHPDVRTKCLTYLINVNTDEDAENNNIHTHLLSFKPEFFHIYEYWKNTPTVDRCWVPWNWCDTKKIVSKNNSLIMFSPSNDTLHAVKLNYNHLPYQRTQVYGNIWYSQKVKAKKAYYQTLPIQ